MKDANPPKSWGAGRVAFIALLDTIKAEMAQGHPLIAIFGRHQQILGIGYPSFCRLVARYADDARLSPRRSVLRPEPLTQATQTKPMPGTSAVSSKPFPAAAEETTNARQRTFVYDGTPKQDDKTRLIGGAGRKSES